jgi:subtilisin-like proprotein convertase family protein
MVTPTPCTGGSVTTAANPGTLGAIPDNNPATPRDVTFTVSGAPVGAPPSVSVDMTFSPLHTWVGDLEVRLIAPNSTAFLLYGRTGQTGASAGDSSDLTGPYNFTDTAMGTNWWAEAASAGAAVALTPGSYRTTQGGPQPVINTSPVTNLTAAFASIPDSNGTWTLRFTDHAAGDTGAVSAANLTIGGGGCPTPSPTPTPMMTPTPSPTPLVVSRADFDGDGHTDLSVFRGSEGNWYLGQSTAGFGVINWGIDSDVLVPGDYDGDNKTDTVVFRANPDSSQPDYYILNSGGFTLAGVSWGVAGDIPVIGDYDGDGRTDVTVFRPSDNVWYILTSGGPAVYVPFGQPGDIPVGGNFGGDARSDITVYRSGTWMTMINGGGTLNTVLGQAGDVLVPADYDNDNIDDVAVWRPSTGDWIINKSTGGMTTFNWGLMGDIPVPGDYDGDGQDDIAIYRPSTGQWWLVQSTAGNATYVFGISTDRPIPRAYLPQP